MITATSKKDFEKYITDPLPDDLFVFGFDIDEKNWVRYRVSGVQFISSANCYILSTTYYRLIAPKDAYVLTTTLPIMYLSQFDRYMARKVKIRNTYLGMPLIAYFPSVDKEGGKLINAVTFFIDFTKVLVMSSNPSDFGVILTLDTPKPDANYALDGVLFSAQ